jgi:hypothetical protein
MKLITTVSGHYWHIPGPVEGRTACGNREGPTADRVNTADMARWPLCQRCQRTLRKPARP